MKIILSLQFIGIKLRIYVYCLLLVNQFLTQFSTILLVFYVCILTVYLHFICPKDMLTINGTTHFLFDILDKILCSFIFINENVDLLGYCFIIFCTKLINTGFNIINIFFSIILIYITTLQYCQETLVFL